MTLQEIKKLNRDWEEEFNKKFVHKGEDEDDPEEKWAWTIMGSFPIEVKFFIRNFLSLCETRLIEGVVEMIEERLEFGVENKQMLDLKQSLTKEIK